MRRAPMLAAINAKLIMPSLLPTARKHSSGITLKFVQTFGLDLCTIFKQYFVARRWHRLILAA